VILGALLGGLALVPAAHSATLRLPVLLEATGTILPVALPGGVADDLTLAIGSRWLLADTSSSRTVSTS